MWGNDPDLTVRAARLGSTPKQQWINQSLDLPFQHLGYAGRLNGPVDNPNSSCTSCHSVAQWPPAPLIPDRTLLQDSTKWMQWFRNIKGGVESFSANSTSLDYSLQLMAGIANFHEWDDQTKNRGGYSSTQVKPQ
jgi:hypothetical protein